MKYLIIISLLLFGCKKNITKNNQKSVNEEISISKLKTLTKLKAITFFGKPIKETVFLLSDDLEITEFRIELYNFFNFNERNITIEELTWKKNNEEFITAWFEKDKIKKPINVLIWHKDEEF